MLESWRGDIVSAILVRNIPEDVHDKLRARAKREGRSVEALAREALTALCAGDRAAGIDFEGLQLLTRDKKLLAHPLVVSAENAPA